MSFSEKIKDSLGLFSQLGPKSLVGIDIGSSAVKIALLSSTKAGVKLQKFAIYPLPEGCIIEDELHKPEEVAEVIKEGLSASGIKAAIACVGIGGPNTMTKRLQVEGGSKEEIENQVLWESEQYIPFGAEDSVISFHLIGQNEGGGNDVLLAAAREDIVNAYQDMMQLVGLKLSILDLNILSLNNIFEYSSGQKLSTYNEGTVLIDFGSQTTNLLIYKHQAPIFTREIAIGGAMITEEIQRQVGVSFSEAEDLKTLGGEAGNLPEDVMHIIESSLESFLMEIKKTLIFFLSATSEDKIHQCFITGGSSCLPGLKPGLEGILDVPVELLNPFNQMDYDHSQFSEEDLINISRQGSIALGLAMRRL